MYDFIMRLRPEYEQSRSQLLHSPSEYTLDEAFAIVLAEETRLRVSPSGTGSALAAHRFAPPALLQRQFYLPPLLLRSLHDHLHIRGDL